MSMSGIFYYLQIHQTHGINKLGFSCSNISSTTIGMGFHLPVDNGQTIWEQTAQWQANQAYLDLIFSQGYPLFSKNGCRITFFFGNIDANRVFFIPLH